MNTLIRISNVLNLTRQEFTAIEKHIMLFTLFKLKEQQGFNVDLGSDREIFEVEFSAADLKETNRERIKQALDKITSRKIFFDESNGSREYFGYMVPFIYANYDAVNGSHSSIKVHLNPVCKKLFLELANGYTTTDLKAILNLKSTYSIRMYELLSMYANKGEWTIEVDKLKNLLGLEYGNYKTFTLFEKYVLIYSQKELAENCDLWFEWSIAAKERKRITALTFNIKRKGQVEKESLELGIQHTIDFVTSLETAGIAEKVYQASAKYSLTKKQLEWIMASKERVSEFIRLDLIIEDKTAKGKGPKNRTKYMAKSLGLDQLN